VGTSSQSFIKDLTIIGNSVCQYIFYTSLEYILYYTPKRDIN